MGILANLIEGIAGVGLNQLDHFITQSIQSGQQKKAFQALDAWEQNLSNNLNNTYNLTQGTGILPGPAGGIPMSIGTPGSPQALQAARNYQSGLSISPPSDVAKSPLASQFAYDVFKNYQENDPINRALVAQQKLQDQITGARANAFGRLAGQRDIGTEAINPGIMGTLNYSAPQLQTSHATGGGLLTAAQEAAKTPSRDLQFQRQVYLKSQVPNYSTIHPNDQGGPRQTITPGLESAAIKNITQDPLYRQPLLDDSGTPVFSSTGQPQYGPNDRARRVFELASQDYSSQKHPNWPQSVARAKKAEQTEYNGTQTQDYMQGFQNLTPEQAARLNVLQQRNQELGSPAPLSAPSTQPSASIPTQSNAQQPQSTTSPMVLTPGQISAIDTRAKNASPVEKQQIKDGLIQRGIDPSQIPSFQIGQPTGKQPQVVDPVQQLVQKKISEGVSPAEIRQVLIQYGKNPQDYGLQAADPIQQKVDTLRSRGVPSSEIKKALVQDGKNPRDYGF